MTDTIPPDSILGLVEPKATAPSNHATRAGRLGLPMLGFYGVGGFADNMAIFGLGHMLLFYLTIVCGLSGSQAGLAVGIALVVDAFVEPLMGSMSDNSHSKFGRRHPFMLAGAIPLALGFGLLYSIPQGLTGTSLFAYVLVMLVGMRIAHSVYNVPYRGLGAELTDDYHERSLVVGSRQLFGAVATAFATYLAYGVFLKAPGALTHREGYAPFAWCCGAIAIVSVGISVVGTLSARDRLHKAAPTQKFGPIRFFGEIGELFRNSSFRLLFAVALTFMISWGLSAALSLHAYNYFWKLTTKQILNVNEMNVFGTFAGIFIAGALTRVVQKHTMTNIGMGLFGLCLLLPVPLRLLGLIPDDAVVLTVTVAAVLQGVGLSLNLVGYQSMLADAADEHEHRYGTRREGLFQSGSSLAAKISAGLGAMIAGVGLDAIGFPHAAGKAAGASKAVAGASKAAAHLAISPDTLHKLGLLYGPGAGLLSIVAVITLLFYRLDKNHHAVIREALVKRRSEPKA
jgi:GPH family glycoside/pentoside/hexuronide:cation symporter